jgi:hypothetical protein
MEAAVRANRSRVLITLPSGIVALAKFGAANGWIVRDSDVRYSDDSATAQSFNWNGVVKYSDNSHNSSPIVMLNSLGEN